jgi:hypothetical protein
MQNFPLSTPCLSRCATLLGLLASVASLATGCTDPKSRFHDFENAFPDAGPPPDAMVALPDAAPRDLPDPTGTYYITFVTVNVDPDDTTVTNLLWTIEAQKDANGQPVSMTMTTQTLSTIPKGRVKVGTPITKTDQPISAGGEFVLDFKNFVLVGDANFTGGDLLLNATFNSTIQTKDVFCGTINPGNVISPIPLDLTGSTYVGVRVDPGTVGTALPPPVIACPPPPMPDGGLPDAGPDVPDADLPDAT